jgi:hypothetical protein
MATIPLRWSCAGDPGQLKRIGIEAEIQPLEVGVYVTTGAGRPCADGRRQNGGTNPDRAIASSSAREVPNVWNFSDERSTITRAPMLTSRGGEATV